MLDKNENIEVIAIKGTTVVKKIMPYCEALALNKREKWVYKFYQIGFSQYNNQNEENN